MAKNGSGDKFSIKYTPMDYRPTVYMVHAPKSRVGVSVGAERVNDIDATYTFEGEEDSRNE